MMKSETTELLSRSRRCRQESGEEGKLRKDEIRLAAMPQRLVRYGKGIINALFRCKELESSISVMSTELRRCLGTFDLTLIGIGSTLGSGVYILTGDISKKIAGPAIVISFLIAAVASILSAFCYAEFGSRIPRAGSAYVYTYISVGEILGFVVGWNLLLEYIIGGASVARGLSSYFDSLFDHVIQKTMERTIGRIGILGGETYLDFIAFGVCLLYTILLILGVKNSARFNNICTVVNIIVISQCIVMGAFYVEWKNWNNFAPYGVNGVISGASSCFFAFIGFDVIATTGEEAKSPSKSIPIAIVGTIVICFLAYFGVSAILTLMVPYHSLTGDAALAEAFKQRGLPAAQYIVTAGVLFGLSGTTLVSLMPTPRLLYSMAQDGLVFRFFSSVHKRSEIPHYATITTGFLTAVMALILDLQELVEMVSIGTLMAYTLVVTSVLILRYQRKTFGLSKDENKKKRTYAKMQYDNFVDNDSFSEHDVSFSNGDLFKEGHSNAAPETCFKDSEGSLRDDNEPTAKTENIVIAAVVALFAELFGIAAILTFLNARLFAADPLILFIFSYLVACAIATSILIAAQPQNSQELVFATPLVPWLPIVAIFANIYLLLGLRKLTWIRLGVWMAIGFAVYFLYGIRHSSVRKRSVRIPCTDSTSKDSLIE